MCIHRAFFALLVAVWLSMSTAAAEGVGLAGRIGTLGLGLELSRELSDSVRVRAGLVGFGYSKGGIEADIDYELDLDFRTVSALIDWHPEKNGFHFTGGLVYNQNEITARNEPASEFLIGGVMYPAAAVGDLTGRIGFEELAPYVGVGWDNTFGSKKRLGMSFDLGVLFQGSPQVSLTADGPLSADPQFQEALTMEEDQFEGDISEYEIYPVISLGVNYKF